MVPDGTDSEPSGMDSPERANGRGEDGKAAAERGILGALPRTRPQRTTPRRAAAQAKAAKDTASGSPAGRASSPSAADSSSTPAPKRSSTRKKASAKPAGAGAKPGARKRTAAANPEAATQSRTTTHQKKAPPRRVQPPAPKQGYEPEEELELGATVHPPSGVELVESVAEIFVELAGAGLKVGGRALRDVLSPLRRS